MASAKKAVAKKSPVKRAVITVAAAPVIQGDRIGWRSFYLYAVCLITLLVVLFAVISFINSAVSMLYPDSIYSRPDAVPMEPGVTDEIIRQQQEDNNVRSSIRGMINSFTTIAIAAPLYFYHWRMARKTN